MSSCGNLWEGNVPHSKLPGVMSNDVKLTLREGVCCIPNYRQVWW